MKKTLDIVVNVALLVVASLLVLQTVSIYHGRRARAANNPAVKLMNQAWPTPVRLGRSTLILEVSTTCHFCTESMPFYKNLISVKAPDVRVVFLFPDGQDGAKHLASFGVSPDEVGIKKDQAPTPTLVLLDRSGIVRKVWVGMLSPTREDEVRKEVR